MTKFDVIQYDNSLRDKWQDFLERSNTGHLFHDQRFFEYHPKDRFVNNHLLFHKGNKIKALLTGTISEDEQGRNIYVSHSGASYGGFVLPLDSGIKDAHNIMEALLEYLHDNDFDGLRITFAPIFYSEMPNHHIEFVMLKNSFEIVRSELSSIVHFQDTIDDNFALFRPSTRTATRKALKEGVEVRFNENWVEFYEILEKNLAMRHDVKPTHTLDELLKLKKLIPGRIKLLSSFKDDKMLAGVVTFELNEKAILAFYISHRKEYQKLRPLNILFYELFKWGIESGYEFLDFGTYTLDMEPNFGLARFKEGFGARGIFRSTWMKIF
ncbi:MAG: GNAT family N-acetyltransferase [Candidatus Zixiibacteriota bacterium]